MRFARPYVGTWRPVILLAALSGTLALTVAFPDGARIEVVAAIAFMTAISLAAALAQRLGADTGMLVLGVTCLDVPLIAIWAMQTSAVGESLAALVGPILIAALFCGTRTTLLIGAGSMATTLAIWFGHERWAEPQVIPDVLWILAVATSISWLLARETEHAVIASGRSTRRLMLELDELEMLRSRLVADVSHELRTPLTAINGFLDTALRDDLAVDAPSKRELLLEARRGGARLELLITDLLDVERAELGTVPLTMRRRPIGPLIDDVVRGTPRPPDRPINSMFADAALRATMVSVDEERFAQMLGSLIENAIRHGNGRIEVRCTVQGRTVQIDVTDEGEGLPVGRESQAFERFTSFGEHHGSAGLGLTIARALAIAHGGSLEFVHGADDRPHSFRLLLPRAGTFSPGVASVRR